MSYLSRGDVALDVSIGILSTLCAPFMIPLLMQWLASQYVCSTRLSCSSVCSNAASAAAWVTADRWYGIRTMRTQSIMPLDAAK